ncbi:DoxX family protein [Pelagibacterium montanilacus]|uniref:DoxX family protein n=1 Tax=Pelagibacterium montanilacus TaxID=2185280 RepID=UPI000F8E3E0F|nr:DoxX family protein [Pelagibacterium montanilacus]
MNRLAGYLWTRVNDLESLVGRVPLPAVLLVTRIALAVPFLRSGLTKWDGLGALSPSHLFLFRQEFKLHILGNAYPYPFPDLMAWAAAIGEIVLPALLIAGLFTRFSALGVLAMTIVIQLTIPSGWANFHLPWAAMALVLMQAGGGRLSADALLLGKPRVMVKPQSL